MSLPERLTHCVLALVFISLGAHGLRDPDLGWHLAGGLYILENFKVPQLDFLGSQDTFWWCYSWLAEALFAFVFSVAKWPGLLSLQVVLVLVFGATTVYLIRYTMDKNILSSPPGITALLISTLLVAALSFPVQHLRPQLISLILFTLVLIELEKEKGLTLRLVLYTILWANIHVYWLLAPACMAIWNYSIKGLDKKTFSSPLLLGMAGLLTPYGPAQQISGIYTYLFKHKTGYHLIKEFEPLGLQHGFVGVLLLGAIVFILFALIRSRKIVAPHWLLLSSVLLVAGVIRVKFIPLAAISLGPILAAALSKRLKVESSFSETKLTRWETALVGSVFLGFSIWVLRTSISTPPLGERNLALISASQVISHSEDPTSLKRKVVLSDFNDAGWLELGFWLNKPRTEESSLFRLVIDGRTLVVGQKRLKEYSNLLYKPELRSAIIREWDVSYAVLPKDVNFTEALVREGTLRPILDIGPLSVLKLSDN